MTRSSTAQPGFVRRWLRRGWRTFKWLTLLLFVAAIGYIVWTNHRGRVAIDRVIGELEKRNIPVGLEQWERARRGLVADAWDERYWDGDRFVEPAQNAAIIYEAAFVLANRIDRNRIEFDVPFLGVTPAPPEPCERIHPELTRQLDAFVQQHHDVFDLLAKARMREQCDFAIDPTQKPMVNHSVLGGARFASYLLQIQCLRAQAHDDGEQVAASIEAMFDLAAAMDDEPSYVAGLVQLSLSTAAAGTLEYALSRMELTARQLDRLEQRFRQRLSSDLVLRCAESEFALHHDWLRTLNIQNIDDRYRPAFRRADGQFGMRRWIAPRRRRDWQNQLASMCISLCPGWIELQIVDPLETVLAQYDDVKAGDGTSDSLRTFWRRWRDRREADTDKDNTERWIVNSLVDAHMTHRALQAGAVVAIAAERYRLAHREWPVQLDDINTNLPDDPYTGEPMRYRLVEGGVIIYSVGEDAEDDMGVRVNDPDSPFGADDWDFELYDSPVRNSKPAVFRTREAASRG